MLKKALGINPIKCSFRKYLGINLAKKEIDCYSENFKTVKKNQKDIRRKDTPCSWINKINKVKIANNPIFNIIPIKNSKNILCSNRINILKIHKGVVSYQ